MKRLSPQQRHFIVAALALVAALGLWCAPALAQCPLCRLAVEDSAQGKTMARGLNLGILVLLVPPVTVFCSIFILAFKHRKPHGN
ncbi:MAG: hypothetical protein JOZ52_11570 [Acidobacteria bacterium]|nr:hypothetical protein [Acidobacteriota bacterium]